MDSPIASGSSSYSSDDGEEDLQEGLERIVKLLGPDDPVFEALEEDQDEEEGSDSEEEEFAGLDADAGAALDGESDSSEEDDPFEGLEADADGAEAPTAAIADSATALDRVLATFKIDAPFFETQTLTYTDGLSIPDASNDLERELEFYKQSLWAANHARKLFAAASKPFHRPEDYFAEMVKSDEHMERVRQRLLDESASIKASEHARRQRDIKKFGKKVQVAKQQERDRARKEMGERVKEFKKKRKADGPSAGGGGDDDFGIELDDEPPAKRQRQGNGAAGKPKMSRTKRDAKFGFPKRSKENTRESTRDDSGRGRGGKSRGGGSSRGRGGSSGRGGKRAAQSRPGKARRAAGRS